MAFWSRKPKATPGTSKPLSPEEKEQMAEAYVDANVAELERLGLTTMAKELRKQGGKWYKPRTIMTKGKKP
jgi:hypothetical protein